MYVVKFILLTKHPGKYDMLEFIEVPPFVVHLQHYSSALNPMGSTFEVASILTWYQALIVKLSGKPFYARFVVLLSSIVFVVPRRLCWNMNLLQFQTFNKLLSIEGNIILSNLIKWILQMLLNVVETDQDRRKENRHHIG